MQFPDLDEQVKQIVDENVGEAYKDLFENFRFWLTLNEEEGVAFQVDHPDGCFEKSLTVEEIHFCGVEDDKERVIKALERLIERVRSET